MEFLRSRVGFDLLESDELRSAEPLPRNLYVATRDSSRSPAICLIFVITTILIGAFQPTTSSGAPISHSRPTHAHVITTSFGPPPAAWIDFVVGNSARRIPGRVLQYELSNSGGARQKAPPNIVHWPVFNVPKSQMGEIRGVTIATTQRPEGIEILDYKSIDRIGVPFGRSSSTACGIGPLARPCRLGVLSGSSWSWELPKVTDVKSINYIVLFAQWVGVATATQPAPIYAASWIVALSSGPSEK
jgi:hypothetical protein